jgi:hypothetical protein
VIKNVGSCLCSNVQFEVEGSFKNFYLCHCKYCQKDTGSAHAANLFSTTAKLKWVKGEQDVIVYNLPKTLHTKAFCKSCGSALPNIQKNGKLLVVPAGSLDTNLTLKPDAHLFISSRSTWDINLEKVRTYKELPTED